MRIVAVDDEARALNVMRIQLLDLGETDIKAFSDPVEASGYLDNHTTDLVFLDIEMPGIDGLSMANRLQGMDHPPVLVFVTAYPQFSLEAWSVDAADYILKPYNREQLARALQRARKRMYGEEHDSVWRLFAQCFPVFDFWVDGKPLSFSNKKAKELLAYLVHMQGAWVGIDRIAFELFEDSDEKAAKNYYRLILHRLKQTLNSVGLDYIVVSNYGKVRVRRDIFSCDYYQYLDGQRSLFRSGYLEDYIWAEATQAELIERESRL